MAYAPLKVFLIMKKVVGSIPTGGSPKPQVRTQFLQTPPDPTAADMAKHLPQAIARFLREANPQHKANAHDLLSAFETAATVIDNGNTYTGHDEIHRWWEAEASKYTYRVEVSHVEKFDDTHYVVTNHLEGDFPGGVVDLIYRF